MATGTTSRPPVETPPSHESRIPSWLKILAWCSLVAVIGVLLLWGSGRLQDTRRNLVPQVIIAAAIVFVLAGAYVLKFAPDRIWAAPSRAGIVVFGLTALVLVAIYFRHALPFITLPYDLASWSEGFFISDIIKWRTGARLYLLPADSNSPVYTPVAPALTYFLARVFHHPASIVAYRIIQQAFLVLASGFLAAATWQLVRLAVPGRTPRVSKMWMFVLLPACFLFATNRTTNAFSLYLHVDALGILVTALGFWLLVKYARAENSHWLWPMALLPSLAFMVKQYLAVLAVVYVGYLWLERKDSFRRTFLFAIATFGALALTVGISLATWGSPFRYWVLSVMGEQIVSPLQVLDRLNDAALALLPGLLGGAVLLGRSNSRKLIGVVVGWVIMVLAACYTSGITYVPTHLGPATVVGGCIFLAALVTLWPEPQSLRDPAEQWVRLGACLTIGALVLTGMGYYADSATPVSPDFYRYVAEIEHEFDGLPTDRVLTDFGDWVYLQRNVLMKDRAAILPVHYQPQYFGMIPRLQQRQYCRILVRNVSGAVFPWDPGGRTGIRKVLLQNYHEVKRIRGVAGMYDWLYHDMLLSDVQVFEPVAGKCGAPAAQADAR